MHGLAVRDLGTEISEPPPPHSPQIMHFLHEHMVTNLHSINSIPLLVTLVSNFFNFKALKTLQIYNFLSVIFLGPKTVPQIIYHVYIFM